VVSFLGQSDGAHLLRISGGPNDFNFVDVVAGEAEAVQQTASTPYSTTLKVGELEGEAETVQQTASSQQTSGQDGSGAEGERVDPVPAGITATDLSPAPAAGVQASVQMLASDDDTETLADYAGVDNRSPVVESVPGNSETQTEFDTGVASGIDNSMYVKDDSDMSDDAVEDLTAGGHQAEADEFALAVDTLLAEDQLWDTL
jgi:hypothetical protein